jgi:chaperonin cofactor prefoldin
VKKLDELVNQWIQLPLQEHSKQVETLTDEVRHFSIQVNGLHEVLEEAQLDSLRKQVDALHKAHVDALRTQVDAHKTQMDELHKALYDAQANAKVLSHLALAHTRIDTLCEAHEEMQEHLEQVDATVGKHLIQVVGATVGGSFVTSRCNC